MRHTAQGGMWEATLGTQRYRWDPPYLCRLLATELLHRLRLLDHCWLSLATLVAADCPARDSPSLVSVKLPGSHSVNSQLAGS